MSWLPAAGLLAPGATDLDGQLRLAGERLGTASRAVAASALLEGYAWTLAHPLFAAVAAGDPPPDLAAGNVAVRFANGLPAEVTVRGAPVPAALAARRMVEGHLAVLVTRLVERRVGRGPRALWGLVSNGCAAAALEEAQAAGHSARQTVELVEWFFGTPDLPLPVPPLLRVATGAGDRLVRRRVTCCLIDSVTGQLCATCPLLPVEEIRRRVRDLP